MTRTETRVVSNRILPRTWVQRSLLIVVLALSVLLQGCFFDRLITLRSQTCSFDEHFRFRVDQNLVIELHDPVMLQKDMPLIWGAAPTSISVSDTGSTMHYQFQRMPDDTDNGQTPLLEEFNLEFDFIPVDGKLRLSEISSTGLPFDLLLGTTIVNLSDLDEFAEYTCQVRLNPFIRSITLPLDRDWFNDLPTRNELIDILGRPHSTLDDGNGLTYKYGLKGGDDKPQVATFVIWYDETGEKLLAVDTNFSRYQIHTDLLTALMKVQFRT